MKALWRQTVSRTKKHWRQSVSCKGSAIFIQLMIACTIFTKTFITRQLVTKTFITHQMTNQTGILFFLHMHKAGGSTINFLFRNFKKYPTNRNGNPWETQMREIIQFWDYGKEEFNIFLQSLNQMEVKFVAFEWNYFKHIEEIDTSQIRLLTCIRDPYTRFVSTMFANKANRIEILNPVSWMNRNLLWRMNRKAKPHNFWVNYNKPNFYVRMMNGFGDEPRKEVNQEHLETAKRNLDGFDVVIILEIAESFRLLQKYGVKYKGDVINANSKNRTIGMTQEQFKDLNELDYEFYEYARNISMKMLNDLNILI